LIQNFVYVSNMALFQNYGIICEINPNTKGYTRLTISTNVPFKTKLIKFNVWDTLQLKKLGSTRSNAMIPFKVGEEVSVEYSYKDSYPQLVNMVSARVDNCAVCFSSLKGIDAQRFEVGCDGCRLIPEDEHKKRVNTQMQVVSKTIKQYSNSAGIKLELYSESDNKAFAPVIFPNNFTFQTAENMEVAQKCWVVGWIAPNGKFLDVIDISCY